MDDEAAEQTREERWESRLAMPVLIAALVSIPAVFLTFLSEPWAGAGRVINILSGLVLIAETVLLFLASSNRLDWLRRHVWLLVLTVLIIIGVVFALGPVQLFRLIRFIGALRILRTGRIIKAGRLLAARIPGGWNRIAVTVVSALVAVFVAATLADPSSTVRVFLSDVLPFRFGPIAVVTAGLILAAATFIVLINRDEDEDEDDEERRGEPESGPDRRGEPGDEHRRGD